ncbi:MAG: anthranilate phosphoribosyltransferase [Planctomycetes bacterium]|nr:anthranilate phosphoribosyltransferase [Planctomycetota bacterium]
MQSTLEHILDGKHLEATQANELMRAILDGGLDDSGVAALLTALRAKGEHPDELEGFTRALLDAALPAPKLGRPCVDTCGTGGDGRGTFNISTATALLCAAAGLNVAKHGNRSASSKCGSADVIEALGIPFTQPGNAPASRFAFMFAPDYHPAVKRVAAIRKTLRIPTVFNLIGPLANPARPEYQLVGVARSGQMAHVGQALLGLGRKRAFVIHGEPGIDEATPAGAFHVLDVRDGDMNHTYMTAQEFGLSRCSLDDLRGGDARENAAIIEDIFHGGRSAKRDAVVLNAALVFLLMERATSPEQAADMAQDVIDNGTAHEFLNSLGKVASSKVL